MSSKQYIVIHHSLTDDGESVSWGAIRKWHMGAHPQSTYRESPMRDIGYHAGIEMINDHPEILLGRMLQETAGACRELGMNYSGVHLVVVGDFDKAPPPIPLWAMAIRLIRSWMLLFNIDKNHVLGHREVGVLAGFDWQVGEYKSCPGKLWDMDQFRLDLSFPGAPVKNYG